FLVTLHRRPICLVAAFHSSVVRFSASSPVRSLAYPSWATRFSAQWLCRKLPVQSWPVRFLATATYRSSLAHSSAPSMNPASARSAAPSLVGNRPSALEWVRLSAIAPANPCRRALQHSARPNVLFVSLPRLLADAASLPPRAL